MFSLSHFLYSATGICSGAKSSVSLGLSVFREVEVTRQMPREPGDTEKISGEYEPRIGPLLCVHLLLLYEDFISEWATSVF